jgi:hypothetical protein
MTRVERGKSREGEIEDSHQTAASELAEPGEDRRWLVPVRITPFTLKWRPIYWRDSLLYGAISCFDRAIFAIAQ